MTFPIALVINSLPHLPGLLIIHHLIRPLQETTKTTFLLVWIDQSSLSPGTQTHFTCGPNKGMGPRSLSLCLLPCLPWPHRVTSWGSPLEVWHVLPLGLVISFSISISLVVLLLNRGLLLSTLCLTLQMLSFKVIPCFHYQNINLLTFMNVSYMYERLYFNMSYNWG